MMESFFDVLLSLGLFFALSLVACIPVLHLTLPRAVESHFTSRATQGRLFVARRIATNYKILLLHSRGFRIIRGVGLKEEYYSQIMTTEYEFRHTQKLTNS